MFSLRSSLPLFTRYVDNVGMPGMAHPSFHGVPVQKALSDLWTYGELLWELQPRVVVETGTLHGGSALHMAHTLRAVFAQAALDGNGRGNGGGADDGDGFQILTIDVDRSRIHERALRDPAIEVLTASSTSPAAALRIQQLLGARQHGPERRRGVALVLLDSMHTMAHVLAELALVAPLMLPGDYLVVEDTHHFGHPVPYSDGNGPGPFEAVAAFEASHPGWFEHDTPRESKFGFTWNPNGYMVRTNVTKVNSTEQTPP